MLARMDRRKQPIKAIEEAEQEFDAARAAQRFQQGS
jgi:hypothetical protein